MEMRFFWVTGQVASGEFDVQWHPGKENLADYFTKHFETSHHPSRYAGDLWGHPLWSSALLFLHALLPPEML